MLSNEYTPPVVIGGIGGSGTRLIAQCLKEMNFFIGSDLNVANDNLWCALLFNWVEIVNSPDNEFNELVSIMIKGMTGYGRFSSNQVDMINRLASLDGGQHQIRWLQKRAKSLLSTKYILETNANWGWKFPPIHIVVDRLIKSIPQLKYIHVMRNGLDMAYSHNQNQLRTWGKYILNFDYEVTPYYSLKYWCIVHQRALNICNPLGKNFLLLNYDDFVLNPKNGAKELFQFLELKITETDINKISRLVKFPKSIGRFKKYDINIFDESDLAFVIKMGFSTSIK
jgi:hypothetical protein